MRNREKQRDNRRMKHYLAGQSGPAREETIPYRNSERYSDPTAFYAMQNIVRKQKAN